LHQRFLRTAIEVVSNICQRKISSLAAWTESTIQLMEARLLRG